MPQKSCHRLFQQLLCVVGVVQGAPKVGSVHYEPVDGMGLGLFLTINCLTLPAATIPLREKWRDSVLSVSDFS